MARSVVVIFAAAALTALMPFAAAAEMPCASNEEARGFTLRHLQSRLMVAALSCNQRDAYNSFVQRFMVDLTSGGKALIAYFERTGGGASALNRHVTDLANGAGLHRASDPDGFCAATWRMFWELEQKPEQLSDIATRSLIPAITLPRACTPSATEANTGLTRTAAPQEARAPVR
jgi:hypothetical protein